MSTEASTRKSAQSKPGSSEQDNATHTQGKHSDGGHWPIPFDDDDAGGTGEASQTTDPQQPPIHSEY
jgi:hypothetical protein